VPVGGVVDKGLKRRELAVALEQLHSRGHRRP
jgi:hypothetical protein